MTSSTSAYRRSCAEIFAVNDAVQASDGLGVPPGCQARLGRAIDRLRDLGSPAADIMGAERISVAMQHLQMALRLPDDRTGSGVQRAKLNLHHASREWLSGLPMALSR